MYDLYNYKHKLGSNSIIIAVDHIHFKIVHYLALNKYLLLLQHFKDSVCVCVCQRERKSKRETGIVLPEINSPLQLSRVNASISGSLPGLRGSTMGQIPHKTK